jgi:hypothetical protein
MLKLTFALHSLAQLTCSESISDQSNMRSRYVNLAFSSNRILSAFGSTATLESQLTCNIASMLSTDEVFLGCSTYRDGERAGMNTQSSHLSSRLFASDCV